MAFVLTSNGLPSPLNVIVVMEASHMSWVSMSVFGCSFSGVDTSPDAVSAPWYFPLEGDFETPRTLPLRARIDGFRVSATVLWMGAFRKEVVVTCLVGRRFVRYVSLSFLVSTRYDSRFFCICLSSEF